MVYPALLLLMRTPRLPVVDWTDALPADIYGLVRFAERRNLISARVPSHFKRSVPRLVYPSCANVVSESGLVLKAWSSLECRSFWLRLRADDFSMLFVGFLLSVMCNARSVFYFMLRLIYCSLSTQIISIYKACSKKDRTFAINSLLLISLHINLLGPELFF